MALLAYSVDRAGGMVSRALHFRAARDNTVDDLGPYLGVQPEVLFPTPDVPRDVQLHPPRRSRGRGRVLDRMSWRSEHVPLCPRYQARHAGEYARNQTASATWLHAPSERRRGALVFVHGWLEPGPLLEHALVLPRLYDRLGVDVLYVQLPFHGSRKPRSALFHGEFFWTADLVRSIESLRQSCMDVRTLVAWLRAQGYAEVGVTGVSVGGTIAMLTACLEAPPDYIVPIVAHLRLADAVERAPILWRVRTDLDRFGVDRTRRAQLFDAMGVDKLRPRLPPNRQLWIMARHDAFIEPHLVEQQWREWGEPAIEWVPTGHLTAPLCIGRMVERARRFYATLPKAP